MWTGSSQISPPCRLSPTADLGLSVRAPVAGANSHVQQQDTQVLLSTVPPPEFWCNITYFELDTQVRAAYVPGEEEVRRRCLNLDVTFNAL